VDTLTRDGAYDDGPDWSPDGTRIAFVSQRVSPVAVFTMGVDGSEQVQLTGSLVKAHPSENVAWHPSGAVIAFVGDSASGNCCPWGIWTVDVANPQIVTEILPADSLHSPTQISWDASGDSIIYRRGNGEIHMVPAAQGATGVLATRLSNTQHYPGGTSLGPAFKSFIRYPNDYFLRRASDGRHLRVLRGTDEGEGFISFRRPGAYVSTVAVAPQTQTVSLASPSFSATATVTNSDATTNETATVSWIVRDPAVAGIDPTGSRGAVITGLAQGVTYVVVTAGGWRSDSVRVEVTP